MDISVLEEANACSRGDIIERTEVSNMADFPTCVTCKQPFTYKGPKPNLLPCLHSVCDDCVKSTTENLKCCTCVTEFIKEDISIARDVVREREIFHLTAKHRPSELLCTNKDDGNQAVSWCQDCREMFCEHCQISHDEVKVTRQHNMKRIEELDNNVTWGENPLICPKHSDQLMELYDKTCNQSICFKCLYQGHSAHDNVGIKDHMLSIKETIQDHLKFVKEHKKRVADIRSTSAQDDEALRTRVVLLRDHICQTFEELRTLVDQRQKEVLLNLERCGKVIEEQRKSVSDSLCKKNTKYQTMEEYLQAALEYLPSSDIVLSGDKIAHVTSDNGGEDLTCSDKKDTLIVFNKENVNDLKMSLASFGSFLSLKDMKDQKKITVNMAESWSSREDVIKIANKSTDEWWSNITSTSTAVTMDKQRVNKVHLTDDNELVNTPGNPSKTSLRKYIGTVSCNPLPNTGVTYWEVNSDTEIKKSICEGVLILETGISNLEVVNSKLYLRESMQTNVMTVQGCENHSSICIQIWQGIKLVTCARNKRENVVGSKFSLHIGILFDKYKNKISYFDLDSFTVIQTVPIADVTRQVWATFAVYNNRSCNVTLKVVSGQDLQYSQAKCAMINKALGNH